MEVEVVKLDTLYKPYTIEALYNLQKVSPLLGHAKVAHETVPTIAQQGLQYSHAKKSRPQSGEGQDQEVQTKQGVSASRPLAGVRGVLDALLRSKDRNEVRGGAV